MPQQVLDRLNAKALEPRYCCWSNATERGFRNTRYIYNGPRDRNGLAYVEDRDIQFGQMYYIRIRKTFG